MIEKKRRGRPPVEGVAMTGAERTRRWREKKKNAEYQKLSRWQKQELRWLEAGKSVRDEMRKAIAKTLKRHPKVVREYLTELTALRASAKLAIEMAGRGAFAPESLNFIVKKHDELRALLVELESCLSSYSP